MSIRGTFSNSIELAVINGYDKGDVIQSWTVLGHVYHVACRFSQSVTSEIQKRWGSSFFSTRSKFKLLFRKAAKNWEKVFCFRENYIWIGIVKLSLLRTGYFSSPGNVLTSSPQILHVNKRDFFQLNWFGSDEWIW